MKRKITALMCSLAVMGMFSVNTLPAQAAVCTHQYFLLNTGATVSEYHDDIGHYEVRGARWECAACGYFYWDDAYEYYTEYTGNHQFDSTGRCTICHYKKN